MSNIGKMLAGGIAFNDKVMDKAKDFLESDTAKVVTPIPAKMRREHLKQKKAQTDAGNAKSQTDVSAAQGEANKFFAKYAGG